MIQLPSFDYDVAELSVKVTDEESGESSDQVILIHSSFCEEAIKAHTEMTALRAAAEEQGVDLTVDVDKFGVTVKQDSDFAKNMIADYAAKLVKSWPLKEGLTESLLSNMTLCNAIIMKSSERGEEFLKKKRA